MGTGCTQQRCAAPRTLRACPAHTCAQHPARPAPPCPAARPLARKVRSGGRLAGGRRGPPMKGAGRAARSRRAAGAARDGAGHGARKVRGGDAGHGAGRDTGRDGAGRDAAGGAGPCGAQRCAAGGAERDGARCGARLGVRAAGRAAAVQPRRDGAGAAPEPGAVPRCCPCREAPLGSAPCGWGRLSRAVPGERRCRPGRLRRAPGSAPGCGDPRGMEPHRDGAPGVSRPRSCRCAPSPRRCGSWGSRSGPSGPARVGPSLCAGGFVPGFVGAGKSSCPLVGPPKARFYLENPGLCHR